MSLDRVHSIYITIPPKALLTRFRIILCSAKKTPVAGENPRASGVSRCFPA